MTMDATKSPMFLEPMPNDRKKEEEKNYSAGNILLLILYFLISAITLENKCLNWLLGDD